MKIDPARWVAAVVVLTLWSIPAAVLLGWAWLLFRAAAGW